ncbi:histidine kinase dimerization/phospho-acceptor domain-containing protein [Cohnella rhizosphaerae]|uniref:histidine kinase dimerization/phospho-acceptor domain-containing protein n=1 Tax=Cohnella rhizosphaerae TaxID=1457232 RepID=UPI003B8A9047
MISDLAASVAHEVRNPLQVTRGFLQLLAGRGDSESKKHFNIAVSELDRASGIITDFLTFAKPELETVSPPEPGGGAGAARGHHRPSRGDARRQAAD